MEMVVARASVAPVALLWPQSSHTWSRWTLRWHDKPQQAKALMKAPPSHSFTSFLTKMNENSFKAPLALSSRSHLRLGKRPCYIMYTIRLKIIRDIEVTNKVELAAFGIKRLRPVLSPFLTFPPLSEWTITTSQASYKKKILFSFRQPFKIITNHSVRDDP